MSSSEQQIGAIGLASKRRTQSAQDSAEQFVRSKMFSNIFAEGMELVEETATYLDGPGRELSRDLSRSAALTYAGISMRLTTRLMQMASWLLVLRAVREGEMTYKEAALDKYRLGRPEKRHESEPEELGELPETLIDLREQTDLLYQRIARIDSDVFAECASTASEQDAIGQLRALHDAFPG